MMSTSDLYYVRVHPILNLPVSHVYFAYDAQHILIRLFFLFINLCFDFVCGKYISVEILHPLSV